MVSAVRFAQERAGVMARRLNNDTAVNGRALRKRSAGYTLAAKFHGRSSLIRLCLCPVTMTWSVAAS